MAIYEITGEALNEIAPTTFGASKVRERADLQRLLRKQIKVIAPDTLVIAEEFGDWDDSKRRIDLLGLDKQANLVAFELKRTEDGGHMDLQALRYAAMISKMTFDEAVGVYAKHLDKPDNLDVARSGILDFLEWEQPKDDFGKEVRIVLVSAEFSKEVTTTVLWLNEQDLDITCIRLKPYSDNGRVLLDVQQVIPLPDAGDYLVRIKHKQAEERSARRGQVASGEMLKQFWTQLLAKAKTKIRLHESVSPASTWFLHAASGVPNAGFVYVFGRKSPRLELWISKPDAAANKEMFDRIHKHREEIERRFGEPLGWERMDDRQASRIRFDFTAGSVSDRINWPEIQEKMISNMIRFEAALRPVLDQLS